MTPRGSITVWLSRLREGDDEAARIIWDRYFHQLMQEARLLLRSHPKRACDEEDVAISAFQSALHAIEEGRFQALADRRDLWKVLLVVTERKAHDRIAYDTREKRDIRRDLDEAALAGSGSYPALTAVPDPEPDPAVAAELVDTLRELLSRLPQEEYRHIACLRLEGNSNEEIAQRLGFTLRTVQRKLKLIEDVWTEEYGA
jgi:RNA polymerase sigma factor (sigma-70 family)